MTNNISRKQPLSILNEQDKEIPRAPLNLYNNAISRLAIAESLKGAGEVVRAREEYKLVEIFLREALIFGIHKAALELAYVYIEYYKDYQKAKLYILIGSTLGNEDCIRLSSHKGKVFDGPLNTFKVTDYITYLTTNPYNKDDENTAKKHAEAAIKNNKKYGNKTETLESLKSAIKLFEKANSNISTRIFDDYTYDPELYESLMGQDDSSDSLCVIS